MDVQDVNSHTQGQIKSENAKSVKVLEELLSKLTVSKSQDQINAASNDLASFVNGAIEEQAAPTQYVYKVPIKMAPTYTTFLGLLNSSRSN